MVDALDLVNSAEFNPDLREPGLKDRLLSGVSGLLSSLQPGEAAVSVSEEEYDAARDRERAITILLGSIEVRRSGISYLIDMSVTTSDPTLSREIANSYADEYLTAQYEEKFQATQNANSWLNERVESLRDEVRAKEAAVATFREQAGLIDAQGSTLTEQQVSDVNAQLVMQRAALAEAEARLNAVQRQVRSGGGADSISEVLQSEVIRDLRSQQAEMARRESELSSRYGPRHPEMQTVARERADLDAAIAREIDRIVASLSNEVTVARERVRSLQGSLAGLRNRLSASYADTVRLQGLEREAEASRTLFQNMLNRFQETTAQESLTESDARIVAYAVAPFSPSAPNIPLNLALGLLVGLGLGASAVLLLEIFETRIFSSQDVEHRLGLPHIASVPQLKLGLVAGVLAGTRSPIQYVVKKPLSGFTESIRLIRSSIHFAADEEGSNVVAICSSLPGEGKTTTAICLGRVSAMAEANAVVVDCDLRRRFMSRELAPRAEHGWLETLNGGLSLDEVIRKDKRTSMDIVPLGGGELTTRDVFGSPGFKRMIEALRERYDLVVLDTPPVLVVAEAAEIARAADAVVLNVAWGKTRAGVARSALERLEMGRAKVVGAVLTGVDMKAQDRYGDEGYGSYYNSYRKYYAD